MGIDYEEIRRLVRERPKPPSSPKPKTVPVVATPPVPRTLFPLPCVHQGSPAPPPQGQPAGREYYVCEAGRGVVCKCVCNPSKCSLYTADRPEPEAIRAGVVLSHYGMPKIIDLQIRLIRATCGDVPLLVHDDHSPNADELKAICASHNVPVVQHGSSQLGHASGCVASVYQGLKWAKERELTVLCKLSQRFLVTRDNWLQKGASDLLKSGRSTLSDACIEGKTALPIRSEAMLLLVEKWTQEHILKHLRPRRLYPYSAEAWYSKALQKIGGGFATWSLLGGPSRVRKVDGVLWHCANSAADYHKLAAEYGVDLGPDFFVAGWPKHNLSDWG